MGSARSHLGLGPPPLLGARHGLLPLLLLQPQYAGVAVWERVVAARRCRCRHRRMLRCGCYGRHCRRRAQHQARPCRGGVLPQDPGCVDVRVHSAVSVPRRPRHTHTSLPTHRSTQRTSLRRPRSCGHPPAPPRATRPIQSQAPPATPTRRHHRRPQLRPLFFLFILGGWWGGGRGKWRQHTRRATHTQTQTSTRKHASARTHTHTHGDANARADASPTAN
jgi:hypothetical protein